MAARWLAFVIWAVVAATAAGWALRLLVSGRPAPEYTSTVDMAVAARGDLTRVLGAEEVAEAPVDVPVADSRFKLIGLAAAKPGVPPGAGVALIAVDGKPPRAFRVGAVVEGETVLQEIRPRGAALGPRGGAARVNLELPPLPPPATGTAPLPGGGVGPVSPSLPQAVPPQPAFPMPAPALPQAVPAVEPPAESGAAQLPQS